MKKLAVFLVLVVGGLVAFNFATTGELSLVPDFSRSAEQQSVQDLVDRFSTARSQFAQAHRSAGLSGIDTSSEADAAAVAAKRVRSELKSLQNKLTEEKAVRQAKELARDLEQFVKTL